MKKPLLFAITAVFAAGPVFAQLSPVPLGHPGSFNLSGGVTRVDVANSILEVNGLAIRVAPNAQILRGDLIGIPTLPGPPEDIPGPWPPMPGPRPPMPPIVPPFTLANILVGDRVDVWGIIERGALVANRIHLLRLDMAPPPGPPFPPPGIPPIPTPFPLPIVSPIEPRLPEHPGIFPPPLTPEERARILQNIQEQINEITRRIGEMLRERLQPAPPPGGGGIFPPVQPLPF